MKGGRCRCGGERGTYIGVVIFSRSASSEGVSGRIRARRWNSMSVGMFKREWVSSKMLGW